DIREKMSDEDWQTLAALETVLHAVMTLRTAAVYGVIAMLFNLFLWTKAADHFSEPARSPGSHWLSPLGSLLIVGLGSYLMVVGRRRLGQLQTGPLMELLPWCTSCVVMVFVVNVILNLMLMFSYR